MPDASIAFFDLDGTLVVGQTQRLFVSFLRSRGEVRLDYMAAVGLWFAAYKLGLVEPTDSLRSRGARFLEGRTPDEVVALMDDFTARVLTPRLHPGAVMALARHRDAGDRVVILSAALEPLVEGLARRLGVVEWVATGVEMQDGRYSGRLSGRPLYGVEKVAAAQRVLDEGGVDPSRCFAYADHETDIAVLESVGHPVAVRPSGRLLQVARDRGWTVLP